MTDKQFLVDINLDIESKEYDLVLCKLNEEPIQELYNIDDFEIKKYFANIEEITFTIPFYISDNDGNQKENDLFNMVDGSMMVLVDDMKYFILTNPAITTDEQTGEIKKNIIGFSREYEFAQKLLSGYEASSRLLYDHTNKKDENGLELGFLNHVENNTSWTVGYVNANLLTKYRSFSFSKSTYLQSFQEVQKSFGCLFQFDTINKVINVYEATQLGKSQGLYISDKNFINKLSQNINHDEIKTRLFLYGRDNVSIQPINITGQPYIDNLSFFKSTKYMTQNLINALNSYDNYVKTKQSQFNGHISQLKTLNDTLSAKQIELTALNTELKVIESNLDIAIAEGKSLATLKAQQTAKINQINTKQNEIDSLNFQINGVHTNINSLRTAIDIKSHLTPEQIKELDPFIREDEYSDSNYTEDNIQELFDEGKKVLDKISYPKLQFDVDVHDFLSLVEGQHIRDKLILGDLVTIEHEELGFDIEVRLIGYTHNPNNNSLKLIFSNRDSIDDANIYLKDLLESLTTAAGTVDYSKFKWNKGEDVSNKFSDYIRQELDLSNQAIAKAEGQRPVLDERGLWLYKENPDGSISPEQIRAINNVIAITKDNWNTVEVAITPEGVKAALLMGQIILGADLKIVSDNGIVEILNNLISIRDDKNRLRVALGNYANGKYGLLIKDKVGNKTVLDEDGMLQVWQEGNVDNVDALSPLILNLYIPNNALDIRETLLRFKMLEFRSYSKTTASAGYYADTTTSGGGVYTSTGWDGGTRSTTETNDTKYDTSGWEGGTTETSRINTPSLDEQWVETRAANGHVHEFRKTIYHEHNVTFPRHQHSITIPSHYHSINIGEHRHTMQVDDHKHSITIPSHIHEISHGIYLGSKPTSVRVRINGIDRTSALGGVSAFTVDKNNLNITSYMVKGQWNVIELIPDRLGRIDATIFNQVLMGFN